MRKLIDADKLLEHFENEFCNDYLLCDGNCRLDIINEVFRKEMKK